MCIVMNKNFSISHVTKRRALQGPKTPPSFVYLTETFTRQTIIRENVFLDIEHSEYEKLKLFAKMEYS